MLAQIDDTNWSPLVRPVDEATKHLTNLVHVVAAAFSFSLQKKAQTLDFRRHVVFHQLGHTIWSTLDVVLRSPEAPKLHPDLSRARARAALLCTC